MSVRPNTARDETASSPNAAPSRILRATLLTSSSLTIMAAAIIAPSLPAMTRVFAGVPAADLLVRLSLTVTSLGIGLTATVAGAVTDRVGRRPVLVGSLALYAVAGVGGYLVGDLGVLIATRALLGVAVGGIMSSVSSMIADLFVGRARARFLGLQAAAASLGGVVFLPLAGVLAGLSWQAPFLIYAAALLILPAAILSLREAHGTGAGAVPGSGPDDGRAPSRGALALILGVAVVATLVFFMAPTQLPFLLQDLGVSTAVVGVAVAGSTASSAVVAVLYARVRARLEPGPITVISLGTMGAGWVVVGSVGSLAPVLVGVLLGGVGVGLIVPNLNLWLSELVSMSRRGRVLGGLVSAIFMGQFLSPLVLAPLVSSVGLSTAFSVSGGALIVIAALLAPALRRADRRSGAGPATVPRRPEQQSDRPGAAPRRGPGLLHPRGLRRPRTTGRPSSRPASR